MKNVVRRFLLILPVMFCMVLSLAVPISSYAINFNNSIVPLGYSDSVSNIPSSSFDSFSWVYPDFDSFSTSSDFSRYIDSSNSYFYFEFASQNNSALPTLDYTTCQCCFSFGSDLSDYNCSVSGNLLTCTFNSRSMYYRFTSSHSGGGVGRGLSSVYSFTYDLSSREIFVYNANHDVLLHVNGGNVKDIVSNLPELSNNLDVSVEFQPALSGSVDRTIDDNGVSTDSKFFNMTVTNNSRTNIQFRMAIVDSGTAGVSGRYHSETDRVAQDSLHYEFIRNENYYECAVNQSTPLKVYGNCAWHFIGSGGAYNRYKFSWSQMSLEKDKNYDVVVWAIPTNQNYCSLIHYPFDNPNSAGGVYTPYSIDFSRQEEVYRSTFTLSSSTVFNPDDDSFGNVAFKNGEHIDFDTLSSYVDENGQNHVGTFSLSDVVSGQLVDQTDHVYNGGHAGSTHSRDSVYNLNTGQFESISSSFNTPYSVNNLSASISNFGSFLQSIFSYFPSGVFAIFNLALVMVVIIAIIKVVR